MENPFEIFNKWYENEKVNSTVRIPSACCLSTIGLDGFPNARFVSLKEIYEKTFIITGPLDSRKGLEMCTNPKASLTFWWPDSERQVRVQGKTTILNEEIAEKYFAERSTGSKIVSKIFNQGQAIDNLEALETTYTQSFQELKLESISKPSNWKAISIEPIRIEFMVFKKTRLHERTLYTLENKTWEKTFLQP